MDSEQTKMAEVYHMLRRQTLKKLSSDTYFNNYNTPYNLSINAKCTYIGYKRADDLFSFWSQDKGKHLQLSKGIYCYCTTKVNDITQDVNKDINIAN